MEVGSYSIRQPDDEIPASVPLSLIVGKTSTLALALADLSVYSNGFAFSTYLFLRDLAAAELLDSWASAWHVPEPDSDFELHIGYEDGTEFWLHPRAAPHAVGALVFTRGWSGGRQACRTAFVSPLPPGGKVAVTSNWPSQGLSQSGSEFDASVLLQARDNVILLSEVFGR